MFVGRKQELKLLIEKINSDQLELGVVYGQRRIGKTSLILEALKDYSYLYFLARDTTIQDNLNELNKVINKYLNLPSFNSFNSIDTALDNLFQLNEKIILVIDELPFLAKVYPGIISYLQGLIDDSKRNNKVVKIILSGSDSSFMVDLLNNKAKPLYQRSTFKLHVGPLLFSDAIKILDGFSFIDKAKYLAIFGNRPYYLEKLNKKKDFDSNIMDLCFDNTSILIDAPNMTLPVGYSSNSTYVSILLAISNRKHKIKEISDSLHIDDKSISTYLRRMLDSEVIEKKEMFNGNKKSVYYEISDPFIRLFYNVIFMNLYDIEKGYKNEIYNINKNKIDKIIEHGFEDVTNSYIHELNINNMLPHIYRDIKNYKVANSSLGRSIEIDGVSESFDKKNLLIVEAKFRDKDISLETYNHLKESASIFKGYKTIDYYLISKKSFANNIKDVNDPHLHLISLKEMMDK